MLRFAVLFLCLTTIWALPSATKQTKAVRPYKVAKAFPLKSTAPRIINGNKATEGQFPWQVSIFFEDLLFGWFCGGSIISEQWILTAGHCVNGAWFGEVLVGSLDPYGGALTFASQFILHEGYDEETLSNDIGLVQLGAALTLGPNVAIVNLASEELASGVTITVSGWGLISDDSSDISSELNYVDLETITTEECDGYYGAGSILEEIVCANSGATEVRGTCSGDSGGPAVINADSDPVHVAVVSFGSDEGCEIGAPSGFTRTAYYREWIESNTGL